MAEQELPGGWLPPQAAGGAPAPPEDPQQPAFVRPQREQGTNGLAVAALVCAISSIGLLVFSLGLSFLFSIPLGLTGWVCAARAPQDVRPGQRKAAKVLADIQSGEFAREWIAENRAGQENFQRLREEQKGHQIEQVGKDLRSMMPWIEK